MKPISYLLVNLIAWSAFSLEAAAGSLEFWKFNVQQNRLEIITDEGVRPEVQLLANPTRLSVDLPGIKVSATSAQKAVSSYVREVRVGQVNDQAARIVVELEGAYSMRPWEVKVRGLAPNRWFVQLPKFQPLSVYSPPANHSVAIAVPPAKPNPRTRYIVVIDPGHGGEDPGAIGIGGLQEKKVVLSVSLKLARRLQQQGVGVVMTRTNDRFISLKGRVALAEKVKANAFVSIHGNSLPQRSAVNGLETYHYGAGYPLAQSIHRSLLRRIQIRDRGIRRARFYVLRKTSMPAVLVEVGFVTGTKDSRNLVRANYRQRLADAIAEGIVQYLRSTLKN
jgi:N-acetylmuramoyl-L-alanine amidase